MAKIKPKEPKKKPKAPEWLFANITEASKNARKIYFLYIGFLFYCVFTVLGTPDRYIILNEKIKMPILNIDVPLIGFMLMAPLVAIFLFVYLQMYLGRLKWLIDLSTNYAPIERGRLYPWMLNFPKDPESGFSKGLQKIIIKFSLWGSLPIVLGFFALQSLFTHNSLICYFVGITPIIGATSVLVFWCRYERVQRKVLKFITKNIGKVLLTLLMFLFEIMLLFGWIPMAKRGDLFNLDLSYEILTTKPKDEYERIYWGHFMGAHLEGAYLISTILERADLRHAHLQGADLSGALLRGADLRGADLRGAHLSGTDLRGANLYGAPLSGANLHKADLRGAKNLSVKALYRTRSWFYAFYDEDFLTKLGLPSDHIDRASRRDFSEYNLSGANLSRVDFYKANLNGANLMRANLTEAAFYEANLRGADLREAKNLTIERLSRVKTLYEAKLDPELEKQIKEKYPHLLEEPKEEKD